MKNGLIDARFLFASSSFARFAAASVEFVPMAASIVRLLQAQTTVSRTLNLRSAGQPRTADCRRLTVQMSRGQVFFDPTLHGVPGLQGNLARLNRVDRA